MLPLLSFISFVAAILIAELALVSMDLRAGSVWWDWAIGADNSFYEPHPTRIYSLAKDVIENDYWSSDSLGFRPNPLSEDRSQNRDSIVAIGDSFTYGHGVKSADSFPMQLQHLLMSADKPFIVHNAGVPGYGPDQEYIYIRDDLIPKYKPKLILWTFNFNDLNDANEACLFVKNDNGYVQIPAWRNTLYLRGTILKLIPPPFRAFRLPHYVASSPNVIFGGEKFSIGCTSDQKDTLDASINKIQYFLGEIQKLGQQTNTKIIVIMIPFREYFMRDVANEEESIRTLNNFRSMLREKSPIFLDLNELIALQKDPSIVAFRKNEPNYINDNEASVLGVISQNLFNGMYLEDGHLNELGNKYVTEALIGTVIDVLDSYSN